MPQKAESVLKDLKAGNYATVYFLCGEEAFFIDQISDFIEKNAIPEHEKGFNQLIMYGRDVSLGKIVSAARAFPMMGQRQLILVKEAQSIAEWKVEEEVNLLMSYIKNPQPSTILVFAYKNKVDGRSAIFKEIEKGSVFVKSEKLKDYGDDVKNWIKSQIQIQGYAITDRAAYMLSELLGNNLEKLSNEIEKLIVNLKGSKEINEKLVEENVSFNKDFNVFEFSKALSFKDFSKAMKICQYFDQHGKEFPLQVNLSYLYGYWLKVAKVHAMGNNATNKDMVAKTVGVHPYFAGEYITACRNYPIGKVVQNFHHLRHADLQSKGLYSSNMSDLDIYKEMVFKFMY